MPKKENAENLMEGLDEKKTEKKPSKITGAVKLDVFLAETPMDKYAENLMRQSYGTATHTMSEWSDILAQTMNRQITSD